MNPHNLGDFLTLVSSSTTMRLTFVVLSEMSEQLLDSFKQFGTNIYGFHHVKNVVQSSFL